MSDLLTILPSVQAALDGLASHHRVPGASLAVLDGEASVELVTGITSRATRVEVTPETLFQIGSITKVYTTTMVMQLVDEEKIDLDAPVKHYLPELKLLDEGAEHEITPRHLLNHTSGLVGDYFEDHGRGDDCIERYVTSLANFELVHSPGLMSSYSNAGFTVAGRLIERITGLAYHEVLATRLCAPLGLSSTTVLAEEMLAYRYAVGHVRRGTSSDPSVVSTVLMPRSSTAAGSRTSATATDVLRFLQPHLREGRGPDGTQILTKASVRAMQTPTAVLPGALDTKIGLGWILSEWSGERVLWHTGGTIGQLAFLFALPDRQFAVCLLTNSDTGGRLWRDLATWLFASLAEVKISKVPAAPATPAALDLAKYAGVYDRVSCRLEVDVDGDELVMRIVGSGPGSDDDEPEHFRLRAIDANRFHATVDESDAVVVFLEFDEDGRPGYVHFGSRAAPRQSPTSRMESE